MDGSSLHVPRFECRLHRQAPANSDARRKAYLADITFGTNNEFGFDYLRDNMAISPKTWYNANIIMPLSMRWTQY